MVELAMFLNYIISPIILLRAYKMHKENKDLRRRLGLTTQKERKLK